MPYSPLQVAEAFIQAGELTDALETLDQADNDDEVFRLKASICTRLDDEEYLILALQNLVAIEEKTPEDYILQSIVLERQVYITEALITLAQAVADFPEHERLLERYIQLLAQQSQISTARTIIAGKTDWHWKQWAGDLALRAGDYHNAELNYTHAITAAQSLAQTKAFQAIIARLYLARAEVFQTIAQYAAAEADLRNALGFVPDDTSIHFKIGVIQALQGKTKTAQRTCKEALRDVSFDLYNQLVASLSDELRAQLID